MGIGGQCDDLKKSFLTRFESNVAIENDGCEVKRSSNIYFDVNPNFHRAHSFILFYFKFSIINTFSKNKQRKACFNT